MNEGKSHGSAAIDISHSDIAESGLASAFKLATAKLHIKAERSGVIHDVLKGRATRFAYALLLRNLLPAYQELERGLDRHARSPGVRLLVLPELYRAAALKSDLKFFAGLGQLPLLPAGICYAERLTAIADGDGTGLIAHAYARYLGDLSGGQILKRLLGESLGLSPDALAFYDFPAIADVKQFKADYRAAMDRAAAEIENIQPVIDEASIAFQLNIDVSDAVQDAAALVEHGQTNGATVQAG